MTAERDALAEAVAKLDAATARDEMVPRRASEVELLLIARQAEADALNEESLDELIRLRGRLAELRSLERKYRHSRPAVEEILAALPAVERVIKHCASERSPAECNIHSCPCAFDENPAHRFRRRGEELRASCPPLLVLSGQAQPGFMNQRGGLERVAGALARHLVRGQFAQLLIDEREQLIGGLRLASFNGLENARDVAHARRLGDHHGMWNLERNRRFKNRKRPRLNHFPLQRPDFAFDQSADPHFGHVHLRGAHPERFLYLVHRPLQHDVEVEHLVLLRADPLLDANG